MRSEAEPSRETLGGTAPSQLARRYLLATRPKFLTASLFAVLTGTSWGWQVAGTLDSGAFLLALLTVACAQAAINILNDVFDDLNGTDRANVDRIYPYTGGSRFIQNGVLSVAQMRNWGLVLIAITVILGLLLAGLKGIGVLAFGLTGLALGILYSAPPVHLAARGLGEFAVAAGFGLLTVSGAAWLQSGLLDWPLLWLSIPVGCWIANILVINEVPDAQADALAGKRTLVVRLGLRNTGRLYFGLGLLAFIAIAILVAGHWLTVWALVLPAALLLAGWRIARHIAAAGDNLPALKSSIEQTLAINAAGCLWLVVLIRL